MELIILLFLKQMKDINLKESKGMAYIKESEKTLLQILKALYIRIKVKQLILDYYKEN